MAEGLTNLEIADRLVISLPTAKTRVSSIISKLGVSSRTPAATMAVRHRIIQPPSIGHPADARIGRPAGRKTVPRPDVGSRLPCSYWTRKPEREQQR